jgi:hypothetical protein
VRVGISDGAVTEIQSAKLEEGMQVVLSEMSPAERNSRAMGKKSDATTDTNPFVPQMMGRGKK